MDYNIAEQKGFRVLCYNFPMIKEVKKADIKLTATNDPFKDHRDEIEKFWEGFRKENPEAYSEQILNVFEIEERDQEYTLTAGLINFYESFYSRTTNMYKTRALFSGGYVITSDGYYCVAADQNTDINLIGGLASLLDIKGGRCDPELCLIREFKEEIGADINGNEFSYNLRYIKIPTGDEIYFPVGLIYEVKTSLSKKELEDVFSKNAHDNELGSLVFFEKDEKAVFENNTRRPYLNELFDMIFDR